LPPASAFAPQTSPPGGYNAPPPAFGSPPKAAANPFSDASSSGGYSTGQINPYASPTTYGSSYNAMPLTAEEIRGKLLGPAIGISLGAALGIGMIAFFVVAIIASPEFQNDAQNPNAGDFIAGCVVLFIMAAIGTLPSFLSLVGAYAMYRGRGKIAAWVGAIAALFPCNPCFFIGAGFAIWGMVALSDPRLSAGMK
jgi:hypothetical protein